MRLAKTLYDLLARLCLLTKGPLAKPQNMGGITGKTLGKIMGFFSKPVSKSTKKGGKKGVVKSILGHFVRNVFLIKKWFF